MGDEMVPPESPRVGQEEASELFKTLKVSIAANPFVQRDRARTASSAPPPWRLWQTSVPHANARAAVRANQQVAACNNKQKDLFNRMASEKDLKGERMMDGSVEQLDTSDEGEKEEERRAQTEAVAKEDTDKEGGSESAAQEGDVSSPIAVHRTGAVSMSTTPTGSTEDFILEEADEPFSIAKLVNSLFLPLLYLIYSFI